jgi:lipid II:glycine glycyltransferase (peptidoglycan interpeptide bridge formation enzyme)
MNSFLQSKNWMDFQKSLGRKIFQINGINIIRHNLPFKKSYLYSPRCGGSFLSGDSLKQIREIARQENSIFLRIEPINEVDTIDLKQLGFRKSHNIQPIRTLILDITKSEQELLDQMHYKTRYNIKLAEKRVKVQISNSKSQTFEEFWRLMEQTVKRDKFRPHPKNYYQKMLEIPGVELFIAEYNGKIIAANIVVFYAPRPSSGQAIYLHGASDYEYRNLMAPHLLQWEQIKEAKKRGCLEYDFWGIDEKKWPGITRFKKSFAGREVEYPRAYDLIFQPIWYKVYKIAKAIL